MCFSANIVLGISAQTLTFFRTQDNFQLLLLLFGIWEFRNWLEGCVCVICWYWNSGLNRKHRERELNQIYKMDLMFCSFVCVNVKLSVFWSNSNYINNYWWTKVKCFSSLAGRGGGLKAIQNWYFLSVFAIKTLPLSHVKAPQNLNNSKMRKFSTLFQWTLYKKRHTNYSQHNFVYFSNLVRLKLPPSHCVCDQHRNLCCKNSLTAQ